MIGAVALLVVAGVHLEQYTVAHFSVESFMEHGYRLEIVIALAAEAVAIISLGAVVVIARRRSRRLNANTAGRESEIGATPAAATEA